MRVNADLTCLHRPPCNFNLGRPPLPSLNWVAAISPITGIVVLVFGWWLQKGISQEQALYIETEAKSGTPLANTSIHLRTGELKRRFTRDADRTRLPLAIISTVPGIFIYVAQMNVFVIFGIISLPILALVAYVGIGRISPGRYAKWNIGSISLASWITLLLLIIGLIAALFLTKPAFP